MDPILSKYYEKFINFKNLDLKDSLDLKYIFQNKKKLSTEMLVVDLMIMV